MDWDSLITNLGFFATGLIVIAVAVGWVIRELFKQAISKDTERFKTELEKEAIKYEIRYSQLHTERAKVVKKLFQKITKAQQDLESLICPLQLAGEPDKDLKRKAADKSVQEMIDYFEENRIFLTEEEAKKVDKLKEKILEAVKKYAYSQDIKDSDTKKHLDKWNEAWEVVDEEIEKVKKILENTFRNAVGIKDDQNN